MGGLLDLSRSGHGVCAAPGQQRVLFVSEENIGPAPPFLAPIQGELEGGRNCL